MRGHVVNKLLSSFIFICLGLALGYFGQPFIKQQLELAGLEAPLDADVEASGKTGEKKIQYWVAPMDANYRRDKPGKSPMGMDLVPVYEDEGGEEGIVKISPVVQNNLGVRISDVRKGKLDREISTVGYISFDEEKLSHLHTRVEGWVEKLVVKATGDVVEKGQKLFEIYSPSLVNAQEEYVNALKSNNSILIAASRERLGALGLTSGQIRQLGKTRKTQQRIAYFARQDGFIESLNIREGMFVKPAMNVLTIARIDTVWVIAEVFERQSGWIKPGQTVAMSVAAYPEKTWQGVVDYIYPILDEKTRTLRVRIRFENQDELLKPNMFARLTIFSSFEQDILYVRREAIIRNGQLERVVKALGEGRFLSVPVKTGAESGDYIEVIDGLEENDKVVTSAQFLIDSESSLTASFERMEEPAVEAGSQETAASDNQVWIDGRIEDVMADDSKLTIQHKPVPAWGWPDMLMDFPVSRNIDLSVVKAKDSVRFLVEKHADGSIEIIELNMEGL